VVVLVGQEEPAAHPLTRTLYLHEVDSWDQVSARLDHRFQTLGVFPPSLASEHRDEWAAAGADRIAELGWARMPRAGWTHDGVYGMHPMVRLVTAERPRSDFGKYYPRPRDHQGWQREYFRGDPWYAVPWFLRMSTPPEPSR
jgi:long-chain-fatty-acyl-CoA reductase